MNMITINEDNNKLLKPFMDFNPVKKYLGPWFSVALTAGEKAGNELDKLIDKYLPR